MTIQQTIKQASVSILLGLALIGTNNAIASVPKTPHIQVTGEGRIQVEPDQVDFSFSVNAQRGTALEAKQDVDQRVNNLLSGLANFDVEEDDVSASQITTRSVYEYRPGGEREQVGYSAIRNITVTLGDIARMSEFMDYVLAAGIPEIQSVQLGVSNVNEVELQAQNKAIENAMMQARTVAEQFGGELGDVYSINIQGPQHQSRYGRYASDRIAVSGSRVAPEAGRYLEASIEYSATVHAVFYLQ
ncbi:MULTISPECIES: SIMPL domain-containing protein [Gammaproteobacteria]|uniref:SIMPL domain-containing protein n=1 Tax=Gammaproteobacteria TaxID=1236 RepID=UPI0014025E93|nr:MULTISPECIES: SIMPL domain-containing protein [Gammaproteobacteria]